MANSATARLGGQGAPPHDLWIASLALAMSFAPGAESDNFGHKISAWLGSRAQKMIRIALTDVAYETIASELPKGSARWPMQHDRGQGFIQVEAAVVDRMRAMRQPGESYSHVILRLIKLDAGDLK